MTILRWAPRIAGLLFAAFLSLFALDVFTPEAPLGEALLAFVVHLAPAYMVLAVTALGWRWPVAGALAFWLLGIGYAVFAMGLVPWLTIVILSGPAVLIGLLFAASALRRFRLSTVKEAEATIQDTGGGPPKDEPGGASTPG